ncbi:hypothetical protein QBC39DRAFT_329455 [Podospora conica]|nr:hypothetical protein QBC39DRAFT_329455 [Schizothecium conicum]
MANTTKNPRPSRTDTEGRPQEQETPRTALSVTNSSAEAMKETHTLPIHDSILTFPAFTDQETPTAQRVPPEVCAAIQHTAWLTTIETTGTPPPTLAATLTTHLAPHNPQTFSYLVGTTIVVFSATAGEHKTHVRLVMGLVEKGLVAVPAVGGLVVGNAGMEYRLKADEESVVRLVGTWGAKMEGLGGTAALGDEFVKEMERIVVAAAWAGVEGFGRVDVMGAVVEEEEEDSGVEDMMN